MAALNCPSEESEIDLVDTNTKVVLWKREGVRLGRRVFLRMPEPFKNA